MTSPYRTATAAYDAALETIPIEVALAELAAATDRLLSTVDTFSAADFAAPSVLPGWSRAHVLAHLALNAKGLAGVLSSMDHPQPLPIYASVARRDADIDQLAAADAARIADRLAVGSAVLAGHLGGGPTPEQALESVGQAGQASQWQAAARVRSGSASPHDGAGSVGTVFADTVWRGAHAVAELGLIGMFERTPGGRQMRLADIPYMRWREVEIHHADLAAGYGPADWPEPFAEYLFAVGAYDRDRLGHVILDAVDAGGAPPVALDHQQLDAAGAAVVSGTRADLAWWLIGRGTGDGLTGLLPELGPWTRRPSSPPRSS